MKRLASLTFLVSLVALPVHAAELNRSSTLTDTVPPSEVETNQPGFVTTISDLPLMPGLSAVEDEDTFFDSPTSGRIAESYAEGSIDVDSVYDFYRKSLPHLGWKLIDARNYVREKDHLRIDARANGKTTTVRFSVRPE